MSLKARKSLCPWVTCDMCQVTLSQKDTAIHEQNCPPKEPWNHGFIQNNVFFGFVEVYKSELPKNINTRESNNFLFISELAMQLCEIAIGDAVLIFNNNNVIVKSAWPMNDKSLTSVFVTKQAKEVDRVEGSVRIEKLKSNPFFAEEIIIEPVGKSHLQKVTTELYVQISNYNHQRIFSIGNRMSIPYYGKKLVYKILDAQRGKEFSDKFASMAISENQNKNLYLALFSTKWTIINNSEQKEERKKQTPCQLQFIGGYSKLIKNLKESFNIGLGKFGNVGFYVCKSILLYGPPGVGKSVMSEAVLTEIEAHIVKINASDINKNFKETETVLNSIFEEAYEKAPSVILIENIDTLSSKTSDLERLFDSLQRSNKPVMVLSITSKPHMINPSLRRPGRIDEEYEMSVPTREMRKEILLRLIMPMSHTLNHKDVDEIAYETHGFVGADLRSLCQQAEKQAIIRQSQLGPISDSNKDFATREDFNYALNIVHPSEMKEILIDVPNVKWSDIGGQKDLKSKLLQSIEWPLRHPEIFTRLKITPPKGVLMFGPPGCSKTMIAKALATESKLNFLNIKGPELFSKWVGESERAVRELFKRAKQVAPSIIFIDEIDALGAERSTSTVSAGSSVQERILTQLLTELDGVTSLRNVTLVAATNRPDKIDKALLRPGRFDSLIYVPLPDADTRLEIFRIKLHEMPTSEDVDIKDLVDLTEGYSGAEIQAICQQAGLEAAKENINATQITKEHFRIALSIVVPGTQLDLIKIYEKFLHKSKKI